MPGMILDDPISVAHHIAPRSFDRLALTADAPSIAVDPNNQRVRLYFPRKVQIEAVGFFQLDDRVFEQMLSALRRAVQRCDDFHFSTFRVPGRSFNRCAQYESCFDACQVLGKRKPGKHCCLPGFPCHTPKVPAPDSNRKPDACGHRVSCWTDFQFDVKDRQNNNRKPGNNAGQSVILQPACDTGSAASLSDCAFRDRRARRNVACNHGIVSEDLHD